MSDDDVTGLLQRLSSAAADAAWSDFIARFSPLIMGVVRRHEFHDGPATDCFVHACAALSDDQFRRLRSFRADGTARFETWLKVVVSNLCIDWRRRQSGRFRPMRVISRLSDLEQQVFRCLYVNGMQRTECLHVLQAGHPELTDQRLSEINARLFVLLGPQKRWQARAGAAGTMSLDALTAPAGDEPALQLEEPAPGPESLAQSDEERESIRGALARLAPQQRLLLRLRYEQDLTLAEIARLTGQPDPFRVNRQVDAALVALRKLLDP